MGMGQESYRARTDTECWRAMQMKVMGQKNTFQYEIKSKCDPREKVCSGKYKNQ